MFCVLQKKVLSFRPNRTVEVRSNSLAEPNIWLVTTLLVIITTNISCLRLEKGLWVQALFQKVVICYHHENFGIDRICLGIRNICKKILNVRIHTR